MGLDGSWAESEARLDNPKLWWKNYQFYQVTIAMGRCTDFGVMMVFLALGEKHAVSDVLSMHE